MYEDFERNGYAILPEALSRQQIADTVEELETLRGAAASSYAGVRNLFAKSPAVRALATGPVLRPIVGAVLGPGAFATRGLLFDKSPAANWWVGWHQDKFITVRERREVAGYHGFWRKEGVLHVIPPLHVLSQMLTVRIHLDAASADNGALEVLPGSHAWGMLSDDAVAARSCAVQVVTCAVPAGGIMLMRPLILHASRKSVVAERRRVVHLEYAACELEGGLEWNERL